MADLAQHTPRDLRSLGDGGAILDGNNLSDFGRGKFSDPVVEGLE